MYRLRNVGKRYSIISTKGGILIKHSQEEISSTLDIISHSAAQTQRLGVRLGELLQGGELILLNGQLGTGKTTFTQGLAQGMGITENINSPTFTLLKEYRGQPRITSEASQDVEKHGAGATFMAPTSVQRSHLWRPSKGPALFH